MDRTEVEKKLSELLDSLAAIEHERWAHWQKYVHNQAVTQKDGSLLIPRDLVRRWERQINTDFHSLSEAEKESDREQVRKYMPIIANKFSSDEKD